MKFDNAAISIAHVCALRVYKNKQNSIIVCSPPPPSRCIGILKCVKFGCAAITKTHEWALCNHEKQTINKNINHWM